MYKKKQFDLIDKISKEVGISKEAVAMIRSLHFNKIFTSNLMANINYMYEKLETHKKIMARCQEVIAFLENAEIERIRKILEK